MGLELGLNQSYLEYDSVVRIASPILTIIRAEPDKLMESTTDEFFQHVDRPFGVTTVSYPTAHVGDQHCHCYAELLYAESGTVKVTTEFGSWVVLPHRAIWFPPDFSHQADALTAVDLRILFVRPQNCPLRAPRQPRLLQVSSLGRELIRRAAAIPHEYDEQGRDGRIMALLLDEIDWTPAHNLTMPQLHDSRLLAIEQALLANPSDTRTLEEWAVLAGASPRNLARLFLKEAGMSFRFWRELLRAMTAVPRLMDGTSVARLAVELGYKTPGAFAAMFKRVMGITPSQYAATDKLQS
jgi:AraC-like DNA-binding protein/quercetin dioxygenase-like cupin family protein